MAENEGFGYLMAAAQAAGDKAMEIAGAGLQAAANKATQAVGGLLAALGSIIPGAGEAISDMTEQVSAAIGRAPSESLKPSASPVEAKAPSVSQENVRSEHHVSEASLGNLSPTYVAVAAPVQEVGKGVGRG